MSLRHRAIVCHISSPQNCDTSVSWPCNGASVWPFLVWEKWKKFSLYIRFAFGFIIVCLQLCFAFIPLVANLFLKFHPTYLHRHYRIINDRMEKSLKEDDLCTMCFSAEGVPEFLSRREIDLLSSPYTLWRTHRPPQ